MQIRHDCGEKVPLVYGPNYLNTEVNWPRGRDGSWKPLEHAFEYAGFCPHIINDTDWQDPNTDFLDLVEPVIDAVIDLSKPGEKVVVAGGSIYGLLGAHAVMRMEQFSGNEERDIRFLGLSVSSFFMPFANYCINNPTGDLYRIPDELRQIAGRDALIADWHKAEIVSGVPFPIVVSPSLLMVGTEERSHQRLAHDFLCRSWPRALSIEVDGVGHDVMDDRYLDSIAHEAGRLIIAKPLPEPRLTAHNREFDKILLHGFVENYSCAGATGDDHTPLGDFVTWLTAHASA